MFDLAGTASTPLQFHALLVGKSLTCLGVQFVTEPKKLCGISNTCDIFRFKVLYKFVDDSSKKSGSRLRLLEGVHGETDE